MSKQADVIKLFLETLKEFGGFDVLVNNAGIYEFALLHQFTEESNVAASYLSDMLRATSGQNTQQHNKPIGKAKEILANSNLPVSEIASRLGFEFPQSFNKLFKNKTNMSPPAYRQSFN